MKLLKLTALCALLALGATSAWADTDYHVIPLPRQIETPQAEGFRLEDGALIAYDHSNVAMETNVALLKAMLSEQTGLRLVDATTKAEVKKAALTLRLGLKDATNHEAYRLSVDKRGITIEGRSDEAIFRGIETLAKSIGVADGKEGIEMPAVIINDAPRFEYRGSHLDCSRHYFPISFIKQYLDVLALHGVNQFHWHITDDQGWRFEVKAMPELAKKGCIRKETVVGHNTVVYDNQEYGRGMYYTQDQCREIVRYAAERYINVIPEIDLPGHMVAALHVYPELGCTGGPYDVWTLWGVADDVLCAGNPKTMDFLKTVLGELTDVFPSKYIHIGGDESPRVRWKACPKCQAKMKELGIQRESQLQTYINKELETFLSERGRSIIGWDETLEGGLSPNALVMSWRGYEGGIAAARQHHGVIMTPTGNCYIDYYQLKNTQSQPLAIGGYLPLSKVYDMEPVPAELTEEESKYILGAQCNLWTEYVTCPQHAFYMLLPRLDAMSEVQWTAPEQKDFKNFEARLPRMLQLYKKMGVTYCPRYE